MERLDQCHLHPKLEVPRLTCSGRLSKPGLRGGMRVLFEQKIIEISILGRGKNGGFVSASRYVAKFGFGFVQESAASQHRWFKRYL
jgi:hypothetical protein